MYQYFNKQAQLESVFPYITMYSKLFVWHFEEYKMIYLEGDKQVYANIDFLFDFPDGYIHTPLTVSVRITESSSGRAVPGKFQMTNKARSQAFILLWCQHVCL
ncbi:hypothetical protein SLA2020_065210 [Shorea laevis]